jgi:hypothetical protein
LHRGNTLKLIERQVCIRVIRSLVILNARAQDKIINNDPVLNRKLAGHVMNEWIYNLAVAAGIGSFLASETMIVARKIVVID